MNAREIVVHVVQRDGRSVVLNLLRKSGRYAADRSGTRASPAGPSRDRFPTRSAVQAVPAGYRPLAAHRGHSQLCSWSAGTAAAPSLLYQLAASIFRETDTRQRVLPVHRARHTRLCADCANNRGRIEGQVSVGVVALIVSIGAGIAVAFWSATVSRREQREVFGARASRTPADIYAQYFAQSGFREDLIIRLWIECAAKLRRPAAKLRPTDRFDHELAAPDFWHSLDDTREDLAKFAVSQSSKWSGALDLENLKTLGDVIHSLATAEALRGQQNS